MKANDTLFGFLICLSELEPLAWHSSDPAKATAFRQSAKIFTDGLDEQATRARHILSQVDASYAQADGYLYKIHDADENQ